MSLLFECLLQLEKLKRYPRHSLNCVIHIDSQICTCGQEEIEEELAREEAEIETREDDADDALDPDIETAYLEAMGKNN
jgi:hypothetical protein